MLISMPTDTSTIFGAFQAILALHKLKPDELRPTDKVIQIEKFASEIFLGNIACCEDIALHNIFVVWRPVPVKPMTHQWVHLIDDAQGERSIRAGRIRIKQL